MLRTLLAFSAVVLLLLPAPALAQKNTDPETAAKLRTLFSDLLEKRKLDAQNNGGKLITDGDLLVEEADYYYAITLPSLTINYKNTGTKIGIIAVNVVPTNDPAVWKMTVAVPTPIKIYDSNNELKTQIHFGKQKFIGLWHEDVDIFTKLDAHYQDIRIEDKDIDADIRLSDVTASMDLIKNSNNTWSGPAHYSAKKLSIMATGKSEISIQNMNINAHIDDYDINAAMDYQDQLGSLAESYESDDKISTSPEHVAGLYDLVTNAVGNVWNAFSADLSFDDLDMTLYDENDVKEQTKLTKAGIGFEIAGFRDNALKIGMRFHYDGLKVDPESPETKDTIPEQAHFDLSINNLPYQELVDLGKDTAKTLATSPQMAQMTGLAALMMAPQILTSAGTNIKITDSFFKNTHYNMLFDGMLTANINAVLGATAQARAEIAGLDALLNIISRNMENSSLAEDIRSDLAQKRSYLEMLKSLGAAGHGQNGDEVLRYDFTLTEDGKMQLNGQDMKPLTEGQP